MALLVALQFDDNYADEFDVVGIKIVEKKWWADYRERIKDFFSRIEGNDYYFGTNEALEWNSAEDYLSCIHELKLTQKEILVLRKALGDHFGIFPILCTEGGEEEEEEEE